MNAWLVLGQNGYDHAPMGLFATKSEAYEFARRVTQEDVVKASHYDDVRDDVLNVKVVEFVGGVPGEAQRLHDEEWSWADLPADADA
jgi:hypothetical protein